MDKKYVITASMVGHEPIHIECESSSTHNAKVLGLKDFMHVNNIGAKYEGDFDEDDFACLSKEELKNLIAFYGVTAKVKKK